MKWALSNHFRFCNIKAVIMKEYVYICHKYGFYNAHIVVVGSGLEGQYGQWQQ